MNKLSVLAAWLAVAASLTGALARAADHKDSPAVEADPATDIADVYAFRSPADPTKLVVAMTVQSLRISSNATDLFSPRARYQFFIDNTDNGLLSADATVTVTFSGSAPQMFRVEGLTSTPISGPTSGFNNALAPAITQVGDIKVFAGPRDDPFFFDLAGFRKFLSGPYTPDAGLRRMGVEGAPRDAFLGLNVSALVIELPVVALTGRSDANSGVIRAWAATSVLQ